MARNALLGLGMVAPDDEWRLTRAVNALGFGPMTPTTQAGRPNALLSAVAPAERPNDYLAPVAETISPTMGAYGAGQMAAEGSRAIGQGDYLGGGAGLALGMAGMIPGAPKKGIRAFHGSPHDFDRFSLDKIGTGEGAQAYGHGLYFAENEGVAKSYRDALGTKDWRTLEGAGGDWAKVAASDIEYHNGNVDAAVRNWRDVATRSPDSVGGKAAAEKLSAYERGEVEALKPGHMYEVRINADPEDFLDWDKPISQQSEKVRVALAELGVKTGKQRLHQQLGDAEWKALLRERYGVDNLYDVPRDKWTEAQNLSSRPVVQNYDPRGQEAFEKLAGGDANYSDEITPKLRDAGIPGIKYLDQGSRGAGDGSRNYVVFRDDIIDIVKKYGLAAAVSTYGFDAVRGAMEDQQQ